MSSIVREAALPGRVFKAQAQIGICAWKDDDYPIYKTKEFTFFRCLPFKPEYYGQTISKLHSENLRFSAGRYSKLFPNQRISYWASDRETAKLEVASHGSFKDYMLFEAYDDASSFIPSLPNQTPLVIADGRDTQFGDILEKAEAGVALSDEEVELLLVISNRDLDCLAYDSHANPGGENFIFFEKGFRKLALREVRLIVGSRSSRNTNKVRCATTSDYWPDLESYGKRFESKARVVMDSSYLETDEYRLRKAVVALSIKGIRRQLGGDAR